ncbi:MAG: RDD family protein [Schlesneria sp.]
MPHTPLNQERVEFEAPPYGGNFIFQMVLMTFAAIAFQIAVNFLLPFGLWTNSSISGQLARAGFGNSTSVTVIPGGSFIWDDEVWALVMAGPPQIPGIAPARGGPATRGASSRLIAFDRHTGKMRETDITLSPTPLGMIVINEQLWGVAETVVYRIEGRNAIPRHPIRLLMNPTKPFNYEGRLAVIDRNRSDVFSLLTFQDGEWVDEGTVDVPASGAPNPWYSPELRVVSHPIGTFMFYSEGQTILFREGLNLIPASEPASALRPDNAQPANVMNQPKTYPGWISTIIATNWGNSWEVTFIGDEFWAHSNPTPYTSTAVQQFRYQRGSWQSTTPMHPPEMQSFAVVGGESGYLVTDDLRLLSIDGSKFQQVTSGTPLSERVRNVLKLFGMLFCYLLNIGMLVLGTTWLMKLHRRPEYLFGKRTMTQASILRRAVARGIDLLVTVFPSVFWTSVVVDAREQIILQSTSFGLRNPLFFVELCIIGMWIAGIVVLSFMEGLWGITPGKWLCGIRTLRTTLRPCGFIRAFARELLVYVDSIFLMTWLPGVLLIAFTPHWQRLGDLTADTVVVLDQRR